jgi:F-type H+-transporting ATPase subunit epsilon
MSNTIQFDLASPQKVYFSKSVVMVTVPGAEGVFGVLPGHAPMAATLSIGVVEIHETDVNEATERLFVVGGFCDVTSDYCTVMADQVIPVKNLKRESVEEEIARLNAEAGNDDVAFKLAVEQAKLLAIAS